MPEDPSPRLEGLASLLKLDLASDNLEIEGGGSDSLRSSSNSISLSIVAERAGLGRSI